MAYVLNQQPIAGGQMNYWYPRQPQVQMMPMMAQPNLQVLAPGVRPYQQQVSVPSSPPVVNYGQVGYAGQMGSGTGLVGTSNTVLTNSQSALTSVAQVKVKGAQFLAEAEGARVIAEGCMPLLTQGQVIIRRAENAEGQWTVISFNKLPMYEAAYLDCVSPRVVMGCFYPKPPESDDNSYSIGLKDVKGAEVLTINRTSTYHHASAKSSFFPYFCCCFFDCNFFWKNRISAIIEMPAGEVIGEVYMDPGTDYIGLTRKIILPTGVNPMVAAETNNQRKLAANKEAMGGMDGVKYRIWLKGSSVEGNSRRVSSAPNKTVLQVTEENSRKTVGKLEWSSYELNNVKNKQLTVVFPASDGFTNQVDFLRMRGLLVGAGFFALVERFASTEEYVVGPQAPKDLNPLMKLANTNIVDKTSSQAGPSTVVNINVGGGAGAAVGSIAAPPNKYVVGDDPSRSLEATTGVGEGMPTVEFDAQKTSIAAPNLQSNGEITPPQYKPAESN